MNEENIEDFLIVQFQLFTMILFLLYELFNIKQYFSIFFLTKDLFLSSGKNLIDFNNTF